MKVADGTGLSFSNIVPAEVDMFGALSESVFF